MARFLHNYSHIRNFPMAFWVVILATLLNQIGNMAFVFLILYLSQHLHFGLTQASLAFAAFGGAMLAASMIGGSLIDRFGAVRMQIGSLIANGLILIVFPLGQHFFPIIIMCLIWGFASGLYRPAAQTFISYLSKPGINKISFSIYRLALNLGMSIGPALGGYLASRSFPAIFVVNGITNLLASAILIKGLVRTEWFNLRSSLKPKIELNLKWLKHDHALRIFVLAMIPVSMIFFQAESTLGIYLHEDLHYPLTFYGWLFTINTLMIAFFELPLNIATISWPYRMSMMIGTVLLSLGFLGYGFASNVWPLILLTMCWTLGEMILYPAASSYIADIAPEERRGSYMSFYSTCSNMGMLFGPLTGGIVMDQFGSQFVWIICGLWGLVSLILFYYLYEPKIIRT